LLLSGTMMLRHLGLTEHAHAIETALDETLRHMNPGLDSATPAEPFTTTEFTAQMTARLRDVQCGPATARVVVPCRAEPRMIVSKTPETMTIKGVDVFLESALSPRAVSEQLLALKLPLKMTMMSNRGTQVWPTGSAFTDCVNHYRVRFEADAASQLDVVSTLGVVAENFMLCGAEWLREIDGERAFSLAQGQA
jgi:isocitrate dehydrogenase